MTRAAVRLNQPRFTEEGWVMPKFKITYLNNSEEVVEAQSFYDKGDWIDFANQWGNGEEQVLRVRSEAVRRIEQAKD